MQLNFSAWVSCSFLMYFPWLTGSWNTNTDTLDSDTLVFETLNSGSLDTLHSDTFDTETLHSDTLDSETLDSDTQNPEKLNSDTLNWHTKTLWTLTQTQEPLHSDAVQALAGGTLSALFFDVVLRLLQKLEYLEFCSSLKRNYTLQQMWFILTIIKGLVLHH